MNLIAVVSDAACIELARWRGSTVDGSQSRIESGFQPLDDILPEI
jgi:hypothetical protein